VSEMDRRAYREGIFVFEIKPWKKDVFLRPYR
jgi:hypothetical protein